MKHMNELEQRLEQASREVRQVAGHSVPPPIEEKRRFAPKGWLVFATAFGAVIVAVGLLPLLSPSEDLAPNGAPSPTTTHAAASTATPAETTTIPIPSADCSAAGLALPDEQEGLPSPVADVRHAMVEAAVSCDFDTLAALAGPNLNTSFGGGGFDNIPNWEADGTYPALELLVKLFDTPYAVQDFEDLPRYYVWPSAFVYDTWDEIPAADLDALLAIYTEDELDQIARFGSYAGWRIGITEDGEWKFFVAGD